MIPPYELPTYARWKEDDYFHALKKEVYKSTENVEKKGNYLLSQSALAELTCERNLMSLDSKYNYTFHLEIITLYNVGPMVRYTAAVTALVSAITG